MRQEHLISRNGEALTDWMSRSRPDTALKISGQPTFDPDMGFVWQAEGWIVSIKADEYGFTTARWHTPDGHMCAGYSLSDSGVRRAVISTLEDKAEELATWPVTI